ncbi:hypothetical protein [Ktedonobacter sp. SOSP1-52]|uniref:hypothetical protein n=1 Tax=Ktedonobacter sp. SOSP1-52 TaxID=2778366 RepID=UPI00191553C9|nr:hypothetical protein [Ktedonobacter sp. SOSP1-52]
MTRPTDCLTSAHTPSTRPQQALRTSSGPATPVNAFPNALQRLQTRLQMPSAHPRPHRMEHHHVHKAEKN